MTITNWDMTIQPLYPSETNNPTMVSTVPMIAIIVISSFNIIEDITTVITGTKYM
jgi:hypothetical protein